MALDSELTLRAAELRDLETLVDFNARLARETEGIELDRERLASGVRAVLDDPSKGWYRLAERAGRVAGQLLVTFEWSDWRNGMFYWIQSVYVRPEARGSGVFRALYRDVEAQVAELGGCGLRLYVHDENDGAREVYRRLGMAETHYRIYERE